MGWIRKTPTAVVVTAIIVGGLLPLAALGGFVALEITGSETADYRSFLNLLMNAALLALGSIGAVGGVSAARSASNTEEQTNGQLTERDRQIEALQGEVQRLERRLGGTR